MLVDGKVMQTASKEALWLIWKSNMASCLVLLTIQLSKGNNLPFTIEMQSDGMLFNGSLNYYGGRTYILKGKRIE
jgi:hypothetical protein